MWIKCYQFLSICLSQIWLVTNVPLLHLGAILFYMQFVSFLPWQKSKLASVAQSKVRYALFKRLYICAHADRELGTESDWKLFHLSQSDHICTWQRKLQNNKLEMLLSAMKYIYMIIQWVFLEILKKISNQKRETCIICHVRTHILHIPTQGNVFPH